MFLLLLLSPLETEKFDPLSYITLYDFIMFLFLSMIFLLLYEQLFFLKLFFIVWEFKHFY